jgi:hypothetical protein
VPDSLIDLAGLQVAAEDFLVAVLETTAQPIWVVDSNGVIRFANPAAIAALGFDSADELFGRRSHETIHHSHPDGRPYPPADCPCSCPGRPVRPSHAIWTGSSVATVRCSPFRTSRYRWTCGTGAARSSRSRTSRTACALSARSATAIRPWLHSRPPSAASRRWSPAALRQQRFVSNWPESQQVPALERCGFPIAAVGAHGDPAGARRQSGVT